MRQHFIAIIIERRTGAVCALAHDSVDRIGRIVARIDSTSPLGRKGTEVEPRDAAGRAAVFKETHLLPAGVRPLTPTNVYQNSV
ncbi:MAG: hypothetical protein JXO72_04330 [Vicinamibacteria bacterium]|nr:hypothetical protein [Vicinamibacteria bacterium]